MFDLLQLPSLLLKVGARLSSFGLEWEKVTRDQLVLSIVREGYKIELISNPPLSPIPIPFKLPASQEKASALLIEID